LACLMSRNLWHGILLCVITEMQLALQQCCYCIYIEILRDRQTDGVKHFSGELLYKISLTAAVRLNSTEAANLSFKMSCVSKACSIETNCT